VADLRVTVVSPEREVFSGTADMVVARGVDGEVGIMANHAPMLIELAVAPVRLLEGDSETGKVLVDGGFLHVTPEGEHTRVDVLAEHAELEQEIDVDRERQRQADAERRIQANDDAEAITELAKATVRLNLRG
jgi:F-type H+-transporting ATPase subunit epsilon